MWVNIPHFWINQILKVRTLVKRKVLTIDIYKNDNLSLAIKFCPWSWIATNINYNYQKSQGKKNTGGVAPLVNLAAKENQKEL